MNLEHILSKLISFKSVTGNRAETDALMAWVKDVLQPVPVYVREYEYNGLPALIVTPSRRKHVRLWLVGHVDVVPADDMFFHARLEGGRLMGRGAIDMKFAIACYLKLYRELGVEVRAYDVGLMLTSDEEWGGLSSVHHLLTKGGFTGECAFLPDGYGSWKFEESAKGIFGIEVCADGVPAHGSKPWLGRSAIDALMAFLTEFRTQVRDSFTTDDPNHWYTSINIGELSGGTAYNVVAGTARATVDMRYVRAGDKKKILSMLAQLKKKHHHISWRTIQNEEPYGILRKNGYVQAFASIAKKRHGIECGWITAHGSSDARFFNKADIPTVLIGPNGGDSHGDAEWVDIEDVERYYGVLKEWVMQVAKKG
jgi:succinyl-diaminopimelate desuccinylase